jgi:signal transduction histidine kinase
MGDHNLNVLVFTSTEDDTSLVQNVLNVAQINCEILQDVEALCTRLKSPAGALILTESSISPEDMECIFQVLSDQDSWSDIPLILITAEEQSFEKTKGIIDHFGNVGNISLLESPFSEMTLVTMTKVAIRSREKQYQIRNLIGALNFQLSSKDEFLSIASHELKTPLTSMKLHLQIKRRQADRGEAESFKPELMKTFFTSQEQQINRLTRLVDDVLDISRIESGNLSLSRTKCDLSEIAAHVFYQYSPMIEASGASITLSAPQTIQGEWDRHRIEQILTNLITNAMKYSNSKPIHVSVFSVDNLGHILVQDQGPGISEENQVKIFERYERIKKTDGNVSGLGLGLYISRQIAELHLGKLEVVSQVGKGAVFTLSLPV